MLRAASPPADRRDRTATELFRMPNGLAVAVNRGLASRAEPDGELMSPLKPAAGVSSIDRRKPTRRNDVVPGPTPRASHRVARKVVNQCSVERSTPRQPTVISCYAAQPSFPCTKMKRW